jgi:ATP-binding cassette subfamily F protein uup
MIGPMSLLSLRKVTHGFGAPPILDRIDLRIEAGERIGLLGRNGAGKTTLLRLLTGELVADSGEVVMGRGVRVAGLAQELPNDLAGSVREQLSPAAGAGEVFEIERRISRVVSRLTLGVPLDADIAVQSAGIRRRVLLARALVAEPDLLVLDEPTNHLDIESVREVEELILECPAAIVFVTHDRAFLQRVATRILDLDRGALCSYDCDYATYLARKEADLDAEAGRHEEFDRRLAREEQWLRRGVKARSTRNMGRVRALEAMRKERRERRDFVGTVHAQVSAAEKTGRKVIRADGLSKAFDGTPVIAGLTTEILRGDRVGLLGPNGAGKTTLLRLLLGQIEPDAGTVRHGTHLEVAWLDQTGEALDEEKSILENLVGHGDRVTVGGRVRSVIGYLGDFLFTPARIRNPVSSLSGGERRRVQLARILARPCNVLVLDEPTNDLDLETLQVLEGMLLDFPGTILLVSHDREFLDRVVTSTLVFEGGGRVKEYVGGYSDWLRQRAGITPAPKEVRAASVRPKPPPSAARRPSYREQQELEALPARIDALERERDELRNAMAAPGFFRKPGEELAASMARHAALEAEIEAAIARWEELESRSSG